MAIEILETFSNEKQKSKKFYWNNKTYFIEKTMDNPNPYRLYEAGNGLLINYFGGGLTWKKAIAYVEKFMIEKFGENK